MLKSVHLKNFKSAKDLTIPIEQLTVLSGFNGSGKSTLLQAISLIRQSLSCSDENNIKLHLRGPLLQLGSSKDILSEGADSNNIEFLLKNANECTHWVAASRDENDTLEININNSKDPNNLISEFIKNCHFQYLQADRLTPQTQYEKSSTTERELGFLGTHGQFTPDFLSEHGQQLEVPEARRCPIAPELPADALLRRVVATNKLTDQISGWLQHLSPGAKLTSNKLSDTDLIALRFGYASSELAKDSNWRRPINVGYGLTYSLPILTACLSAPRNSLLLLENPEAHLHPRGQAALGTLLAVCAQDGVQIIVETHSDHILNGIRLAAKNKRIAPEKIKICNFTRNIRNGESYIETPTVLANGDLNSWPDGFFDQWDKSLDELLS